MRKFPLEHKKLMFTFMNMLMLGILMLLVGTKLKRTTMNIASITSSSIYTQLQFQLLGGPGKKAST